MTFRDRRNPLPLNWAFYKCPWENCDSDEPTINALLITKDRLQRCVWACPDHLPTIVEAEMYSLRQKPPPDLV